jgi:hypothetical protein
MPSAGFLPASSHMKKRARRKCLNAKNNLSQGMQDLTLTPNGQDVKTVQEQKQRINVANNLNSSSFTRGLGFAEVSFFITVKAIF